MKLYTIAQKAAMRETFAHRRHHASTPSHPMQSAPGPDRAAAATDRDLFHAPRPLQHGVHQIAFALVDAAITHYRRVMDDKQKYTPIYETIMEHVRGIV